MKWLIIILILSSCSTSRPKYVATTAEVKAPMENKKRQANIHLHLTGLIMTAFILHHLKDE